MSPRPSAASLRRLVPALAVVFAACDISVGDGGVTIGLGGGRAADSWTRTYEVVADGRLEIVNLNGRIEVSATDGSQIEVRAERVVKARSDEAARDLLKQIEMVEESSPSGVRIESRSPTRTMGSSHEIQYTVRVPRSLELALQTTNGGVSVNGVVGRVRAVTTNGGINGRELGGAVDAATTNGSIRVEFDRLADQAVTLETVNGSIDVRVPSSSKAQVLAQCVNGRIAVSGVPVETIGETSRRRFEGRLNGGGAARIDIETINGAIALTGSS